MPQRPKAEVREAILLAAAEAFAGDGFERATLGSIALRARSSIGNLYKYFSNKEELFAAFMPRSFPADLTERLRNQVQALRGETDALSLEASHRYRHASAELLRFTIDNRARVVFLLLRARGTKHERFADETVRLLVELALRHAEKTYPSFVLTPAKKRALARIYQAFVSTLARILDTERSERSLREALAMQTTYHLSGLKAFFLEGPSR